MSKNADGDVSLEVLAQHLFALGAMGYASTPYSSTAWCAFDKLKRIARSRGFKRSTFMTGATRRGKATAGAIAGAKEMAMLLSADEIQAALSGRLR